MMKSNFSRRSLIKGMATAAVAPVVLPAAAAPRAGQMKEAVDYVNPNMGGIGQLLSSTSPFVKLPYGVMTVSPITTPGVNDRYLADKIYGFPAGAVTLMPMSGSAETEPAKYASCMTTIWRRPHRTTTRGFLTTPTSRWNTR